jgi:hypothetical protein
VTEPRYVFVVGPSTAPELMLFAASIGRALSRGNDVRFVEEEPDELIGRDPALERLVVQASEIDMDRSKLIVCGDSDFVQGRVLRNVWRLSLVLEPTPSVRLETEGKRHGFPMVMSSSILRRGGRTVVEVPRVLVAVEGKDNRRERMVGRICEELATRRWPHSLAVIAPSSGFARSLRATEGYVRPEPAELAALIASAGVVLEPVEGDDPPLPLGCLASSVGIPVVTHATSLLARRHHGELRPVAEWSPDAFVDAVIETASSTPAELSWGVEFDAVAEDFGRVIQSA